MSNRAIEDSVLRVLIENSCYSAETETETVKYIALRSGLHRRWGTCRWPVRSFGPSVTLPPTGARSLVATRDKTNAVTTSSPTSSLEPRSLLQLDCSLPSVDPSNFLQSPLKQLRTVSSSTPLHSTSVSGTSQTLRNHPQPPASTDALDHARPRSHTTRQPRCPLPIPIPQPATIQASTCLSAVEPKQFSASWSCCAFNLVPDRPPASSLY